MLKVEKLLGIGNLYDMANYEAGWTHHVEQALRAHALYQSATTITWCATAMKGRRW